MPDVDPACDISGLCEPVDSERAETQAMCRHCGGWRYRDWPRIGNWGTWEPEIEKSWIHIDRNVDSDRQME
jgi:hypothetical protein